jgi:hypothetical protein
MHRHAAITLSLLCADITYNTNTATYLRLTSCSFSTAKIKGYQYLNIEPEEIIQEIYDGKRTNAQLLKSELTVTAYIPTMQVKEIDQIMEVTRNQSQHISKNKLNLATQSLSIMLSEWLTLCLKVSEGQPQNKKPIIEHRFQLHRSLDAKGYMKLLDNDNMEKDWGYNWFPECISNEVWEEFLENLFDSKILHTFTNTNLQSEQIYNNDTWLVTPPYKITFNSITADVRPITKGSQWIDVCHMNAYQIIPGIMYILLA